jgi:general secretion pathway protein K
MSEMNFSDPHRSRASDGFILLAVLWILGAMATLAVIYSLYARKTVLTFEGHDERLQAQALAMSGVELAAYRITARPNFRPLTGRLEFRQGRAAIEVRFVTENSRIDLNFAPKDVLAGLFVGFGVQRADALTYADRIGAWRGPLQPGAPDGEADIYRAAGKSYGPRRGPFQHVAELGLVAGLPPDLVDRVLPYLTVYNGGPQVNILAAPPQVLAALPELTPQRLQVLLAMRDNAPEDVVKAQLGPTASYVTVAPARTDRVTTDVQFPSGRRIRSQAVILVLDGDAEPYHVLSWQDDELSREDSTPVLQ